MSISFLVKEENEQTKEKTNKQTKHNRPFSL